MSKKMILMAMTALSLAVWGCSSGGDDSANPNASPFSPVASVIGAVRDSVTNEPIVGAVIDIGGKTGTTDANGQYKIDNVQATQDSLNGTISGTYAVTLNTTAVSSPVNMRDANASPRYPEHVFSTVTVQFTSLNDTTDDEGSGGNSSNHDTQVTNTGEPLNFTVGKLDANVEGLVIGSDLAPVADATVYLYSNGTLNDATGNTRHLVAQTETDAEGTFSFSNIEAFQSYTIDATATGSVLYGTKDFTAPADGQTLLINDLQANPGAACNASTDYSGGTPQNGLLPCFPVVITDQDANSPFVQTSSPENGIDINPDAEENSPLVFTFNFSEAIADTAYSAPDLCDDDATASSVEVCQTGGTTSLADDVDVNHIGSKAGNIAHTIAWNSAMTVLTVSITADLAPSQFYRVDITDAMCDDGEGDDLFCLRDSNGNGASGPLSGGLDDIIISTNGGLSTGAPTLVVQNSASIDNAGGGNDVILDWSPVSGAKSYNVYRRFVQVWQDSTVTENGPLVLVDNVPNSQFTDEDVDFDENNEIALHYDYVVAGVNSDGTEGTQSNTVTAEDNVGPEIFGSLPGDDDDDDNADRWQIAFNEPVQEDLAETVSNYSIDGGEDNVGCPTVATAVYTIATQSVELTFSSDDWSCIRDDEDNDGSIEDADSFEGIIVSGVQDLNGNVIQTDADQVDVAANLTDGILPNIAAAAIVCSDGACDEVDDTIGGFAVAYNETVVGGGVTGNYAFSSGAEGADSTIAEVDDAGPPNAFTVELTDAVPIADIADDEDEDGDTNDTAFEGLTVSNIVDSVGNPINLNLNQVDVAETLDGGGDVVINIKLAWPKTGIR